MKSLLEILAIFSVIWINGCNTTEPPPPPDETKPTLTLAIDDTSCTEAWLQLTTKDLKLPAELTLKQYNPTGDSLSQIFILNTQDSLLYIDSLLPNQTYKFKVALNTTNHPQPTTNQLAVTTMDTTSHNFT
ncbi:MAG: glucosyl transferase, partial [Ignavibacteria bacterium]|nr:glucosyl transferase [Ignavibacteria bacterium]